MKKLIYLGLLLFAITVHAQDPFVPTGDSFSQDVTLPNSPEVAALTKYGDYDSSLYTGTPNISIPLGAVSGREFGVPVSLTYDASGIKVEQMATWVGLGWNLEAGGAVSRVNLGQPDDAYISRFPYYPHYDPVVKNKMNEFVNPIGEYGDEPDGRINDYFFFKERVVDGRYDTQPDYYRFSAPGGLSGRFYIDYENDIGICLENPNIKIIPYLSGGGATYHRILTGFDIIDDSGNKYEFKEEERNKSWYSGVVPGSAPPYIDDNHKDFASAWHLTKIISAVKKDSIVFKYHPKVQWAKPQRYQEISFISNCLPSGTPGCDPSLNNSTINSPITYEIDQVFLKEIEINTVKRAEFLFSPNPRTDLPGSQSLGEIKMYNNMGDLISSTVPSTSYFQTTQSNPEETDLRLKLDQIVQTSYGSIEGESEASEVKKHTFDYEKHQGDYFIPNRHSYGQDFWGYYNNYDGNSTLVPREVTDDYTMSGAIRDADLTYTQIGTLNKISYPTGGYTTFDYGLHLIGYETSETTIWDDITGSGGFQGGLSSSNPYGLIDDSCPGTPLGTDGSFTVNTPNLSKRFRVLSQFDDDGTTEPCQHWNVLVIYPTTNTTPNIEEFKNDPSSRFFYREMMGSLNEFEVDLPNGTYNYLIMNSSDKYTYWFQKANDINYQPQPVYGGGLRIDKIRNYDDDDNLLGYKRYYYDDFSNTTGNLSETDFKQASSAILQQPLKFTETVYSVTYEQASWNNCVLLENQRLNLYRYANNQITSASNTVTYDVVTEFQYSLSTNNPDPRGYTVTHFYNNFDLVDKSPFRDESFLNGQERKKILYNSNKEMVQSTETIYESIETPYSLYGTTYTLQGSKDGYLAVFEDTDNSANEYYSYNQPGVSDIGNGGGFNCSKTYCHATTMPDFQYCITYPNVSYHEKNNFYLKPFWHRPKKRIVKDYFDANFVETSTNYFYDSNSHRLVTRTETLDSKGDLVKMRYTYPQDFLGLNSEITTLINQNRLTELVNLRNETNGKASETQFTYTNHNGIILPWKVIQKKGNEATTNRIFDEYDSYGNILQMSRKVGATEAILAQKTSYVWGYDHTYPVAKVDNVTYSQLFSWIFTIDLSVLNNNPTDQQVRDEIDKIRQAFPEAMVTTYTYKPDVGVTSITGPNGQVQYFEYDAPNRLVNMKDQDLNLVGSYEYNYKTN
ncbi:MAG: hypothetical protein Aureis2KO_22690 [Aureisphaera sp.]